MSFVVDASDSESYTRSGVSEMMQQLERGAAPTSRCSEVEPLPSMSEDANLADASPSERPLHEVEGYDMLHEIEHEKDIYRLRVGVKLDQVFLKNDNNIKRHS